jgi:hypothetical protein
MSTQWNKCHVHVQRIARTMCVTVMGIIPIPRTRNTSYYAMAVVIRSSTIDDRGTMKKPFVLE